MSELADQNYLRLKLFLLVAMTDRELHIKCQILVENRGASDMKISVRPDNRTGLIEAGYRPDRTLSSIVISDEGLFSELGNEDYEKRRRLLPQSGEKIFSLRHNSMNFDSRSQIQFGDAQTLFLS